MHVKHDLEKRWLEKIKLPPEKRDRSKYHNFHQDHGQNTKSCYKIKWQIKILLQQRLSCQFILDHDTYGLRRHEDLRKEEGWKRDKQTLLPPPPPHGEIRTIADSFKASGTSSSAGKAYSREAYKHHVYLAEFPYRKKPKVIELPITFIEEAIEGVVLSHNDALVATI